MKNIRTKDQLPDRRGSEKRTGRSAPANPRGMERRLRRRRRNCAAALLLATVLLAAAVLGSRITSDHEQEIRLALGQKNYIQDGEEGPLYFDTDYEDPEELREDSAELAKKIQSEGVVLLLNNDAALPLRKGAAVSVFGKDAVSPVYSSAEAAAGAVSFREALEGAKIRVNDKLWDYIDRGGRNTFPAKIEKSLSEFSEAAIVVIGRRAGGEDLYEPAYSEDEDPVVTGAKALQLTQEERELLTYVKERFDRVIVVLNTENPVETGFLAEFEIDACLWTGAMGTGGTQALADVLSGEVNPSGRLPDTFVYNSKSAPAAENLGDYEIRGSKEPFGNRYLVYSEGVYVGYRYYETRYEDMVLGTSSGSPFNYEKTVAFPFGYGLSYTEFELRDMKMELGKKGYEITVDVYNTGGSAGKEVVQFYIQKPYSEYAEKNGMEIPSVELAGFVKTKEIAPGESERVKIVIDEEIFKSFDAGRGTYIIDGGTYLVTAAQDAHRAINNILLYKGKGGSSAFCGVGDGGLVEKTELVKDTKTYAVSKQTGAGVNRVFREADPASYDSDYQPLTRSLWGSSWPSVWNNGSYAAPASFQELLKVSSKEDNNASAPIYNKAHGEKNAGLAELREIPFDDYRWGAVLDQLTWRETYSLVRKGGGAVNEVLSCISPQALISGDASGIAAEYGDGGGLVAQGSSGSKGAGTIYPSATVFAATFNTELVMQAGKLIGEEALHAGVTFWKMPSLNLHRTAMGAANSESFSEDSYLTGKLAAALCRGLGSKGVIPVLGRLVLADQAVDSTGIVVMAGEQAIRELYLRPFEIALRDGGSGMKAVMAGMNRIGPRWCGGHSGLLTEVLRGEWGFSGIVMTDVITPENDSYADILEGLEAGTDLWQNASNNSYKLRGGQLTYGVRARFRTAAGRILQTVSRSNAMNGIGTETTLKYKAPRWKLVRTVLVGLAVAVSLPALWIAFVQARKASLLRRKLAGKM